MKTMKRAGLYMEEWLLEEISKIPDTTFSQFVRDAVCEKLGVSEATQEQSEFRLMKSQLAKLAADVQRLEAKPSADVQRLAADVQRLEAEVKKVKSQPSGTSASFAASQSIYVPQ